MINVFANENSFTEANVSDLIVLCSNKLADPSVQTTVQTTDDLDLTQFRTFFKQRLTVPCKISVLATIKRNKLSLFWLKPAVKKKTF